MRKIVQILFCVLFYSTLQAQTTEQINQINNILEHIPYFEHMPFDYNANYILPDSLKTKIIKALNKELPQNYADRVFSLSDDVLNNIHTIALRKCKTDTACYREEYKKMCNEEIIFQKKNYSSRFINTNLILACGSWNVKEAIPYLEKESLNEKEDDFYIEREKIFKMSLAKLGNDSLMRQIKESGAISYLIKHTELDTVNYKKYYLGIEKKIISSSSHSYPLLAIYFKNKNFYYDMLDLLYIRGYVPGLDLEFVHTEISLLMEFDMYEDWRDFPNYSQWKELVDKYFYIYINASKRKEEWKKVTSHSFKQHMILELRNWIEANVNC